MTVVCRAELREVNVCRAYVKADYRTSIQLSRKHPKQLTDPISLLPVRCVAVTADSCKFPQEFV